MDMNVTIAIPALAVLVATNGVFSFLRYRNGKGGSNNGNVDRKILEDITERQKACIVCFQEIKESNVRKEVYLQNMVSELQSLNTRINSAFDRR